MSAWLQKHGVLLVAAALSGAGFYVFPTGWLWAMSVFWMALCVFGGYIIEHYRKLNRKLIATNNELQEAADAMIAHAFETSSKLRERIAVLEAELEERDRSA